MVGLGQLIIKFGSTELCDLYVNEPCTESELLDCQKEYARAGFQGCICSTNTSHVVMENCQFRLRQLHLGFKLAHTARTYNLTVNHRCKSLSSTRGHPTRFND